VDSPVHAEVRGDRGKLAPQRIDMQRGIGRSSDAVKNTPHEEPGTDVVVENGKFIDITVMPVEKADYGGDLTRRAGAVECQGELVGAIGSRHAGP
jgi:hypothetical protein